MDILANNKNTITMMQQLFWPNCLIQVTKAFSHLIISGYVWLYDLIELKLMLAALWEVAMFFHFFYFKDLQQQFIDLHKVGQWNHLECLKPIF